MLDDACDYDESVIKSNEIYRSKRYNLIVRSSLIVMILCALGIGYTLLTQTPKPFHISGTPVRAWQPVPVQPPAQPSISFDEFLKVLVDAYAVQYEKLLSDNAETKRVTEYLIADRHEPGAFTVPVYSSDLVVEIVANATLEEEQQAQRSPHNYPMCTLQNGGSAEFVGFYGPASPVQLVLFQFTAPAVSAGEQYCTGGEYFFATPEIAAASMPK